MLPEMRREILDRWESMDRTRARPGSLHFLGIRGSIRSGRVTFLVFIKGEEEPLFTLKILRNKKKKEQFVNEPETLKELSGYPGISEFVPKVLMTGVCAGAEFVLESYIAGQTMKAPVNSDGLPVENDAANAFAVIRDWFRVLYSATERNTTDTVHGDEMAKRVETMVAEYEQRLRPDQHEAKLLRVMSEEYDGLIKDGLVLHRAHGDFCRQNILFEGEHLSGVIDWELSRPAESPLFDMFTFLVNHHLFSGMESGRMRYERCFRETFLEENRYSTLVKRLIRSCCKIMGVSHEAAPFLLAYAVASEAVAEHIVLEEASHRGFIPWSGETDQLDKAAGFEELFRTQMWRRLFSELSSNFNSVSL